MTIKNLIKILKAKLMKLTQQFDEKSKTFLREWIVAKLEEFEKLDLAQKINTLAMIAPVTNEEKQKLLEAVSIEDKLIH